VGNALYEVHETQSADQHRFMTGDGKMGMGRRMAPSLCRFSEKASPHSAFLSEHVWPGPMPPTPFTLPKQV